MDMNGFIITFILSIIQLTLSKVAIQDLSVYNYHTKFGIPTATKIKEWEESLDNRKNQRIVGGTLTDISEVPYQVGLIVAVFNNSISLCGGSLISSNSIITAAHCYFDGKVTADEFTSVLGSNLIFSGGLRILTNDITVHPDYNVEMISNDIAIIKIPDVTFSHTIQPIDLPYNEDSFYEESAESFSGVIGIASGYGLLTDEDNVSANQSLYSVEVEIISNKDCSASYGSYITESSICTSGKKVKGTCNGDSGGPLVVFREKRNILVGVISFGTEECELKFPSAYTRVTSFVNWIQSVVELD